MIRVGSWLAFPHGIESVTAGLAQLPQLVPRPSSNSACAATAAATSVRPNIIWTERKKHKSKSD